MEDQEKMLKLMRFWLFGTFIIIFVAVTIYVGGALGLGLLILRQLNYWLAVLITAALCVLWYYIYKWYIEKKK
jgi:hypothetical protein